VEEVKKSEEEAQLEEQVKQIISPEEIPDVGDKEIFPGSDVPDGFLKIERNQVAILDFLTLEGLHGIIRGGDHPLAHKIKGKPEAKDKKDKEENRLMFDGQLYPRKEEKEDLADKEDFQETVEGLLPADEINLEQEAK
jgi:hypothetical protein